MSIITCKPYGPGQPIYIVAAQIESWSWDWQDQRTEVVLMSGRRIRVGDRAEEVAAMVAEALKEPK